MPAIYFSLKQAQGLLPNISTKVERLVDVAGELESMRFAKINPKVDFFEHELAMIGLGKNFHKLMLEHFSLVEELALEGCIVKDAKIGLVDFFSKFDGRDIFLCWKAGEKEISFWHEIEGGFSGRRHVSVLKKPQITGL